MDHRRLARVVSAGDPLLTIMPLIEAVLIMAPRTALQYRAADDLRREEAVGQIQIDEIPPSVKRGAFDLDLDAPVADVDDQNVDRAEGLSVIS